MKEIGMRIVGLKEFLTLPPWTMFRKYQPCYTEDLMWKQDSLGGSDFVYTTASMPHGGDSIEVFGRCDDMEENGASYPIEDFTARDGCFVQDQLFMIYEKADIEVVARYVANALEAIE
jgi:hypothetical protein